MRIGLDLVNTTGRDHFIALLGGVFEKTPWIAEGVFAKRPFRSIEELTFDLGVEDIRFKGDRVGSLVPAAVGSRLHCSPRSVCWRSICVCCSDSCW